MSRFSPTRSPIWQPASLMLLVFGLQLVLSDAAQATCGDWLAHEMPANDNDDAPQQVEMPQELPVPCSGPHCRRAPDRPLPGSPQRSVTLQVDQWGTLNHSVLTLRPLCGRFSLNEPLHHVEGLPPRIERPPRA